ncbi:helix-turn-helix domain-containing protein [Prauserella endophytica]|uniref:Helix-turn-helix domain-containing protein n=1 Tax=Prauserella endophytica TaxID=1592324 RepID=A0ABY2RV26_9PSEU|nr:helix-turn-helix transcriptional regulator [Prauserella endophytica]TKG61570.1 helix-turn-helix domain-containing protein [Prauserella endophytica]
MSHVDERRELAAVLRDLRMNRQVSTTVLARRLGWSQARVSRIERAVAYAKPADVEAWCRELGADPDQRRHLAAVAERLATQLTEWRRELAPGRRRKQQELRDLEAAASVVRVFSGDVIPGLAQTRAYARVMFAQGREGVTDEREDIDDVLDVRMARHEVMRTKQVELLMSESAIRRQLLPGELWCAQLGHLADLAVSPNVQLGVLPFVAAAQEPVHQYHGYAILGDPDADDTAVALVETVTRALTVRDPQELVTYRDHFAKLSTTAITGDDLRTWLQEVLANTPG